MGETIESLKQNMESMLNAHSISPDSIEGFVIIMAACFLIWGIFKKVMKFVKWSVAAIIFCEFMYYLGQTGLNDHIPIADIFKYDVMTSVAQVFVGTKLCDGILYVNAFIHMIALKLWEFIGPYFGDLADGVTGIFKDAKGSIDEALDKAGTLDDAKNALDAATQTIMSFRR